MTLMVIALIGGAGASLASSQPTEPSVPKEIANLLAAEDKLNDRCRDGSGDDPKTQEACDERGKYIQKLSSLGWCYGTADQAEYQKRWQKCEKTSAASSVQPENGKTNNGGGLTSWFKNLGPQLLPCDSPELEKKANDAMADSFDAIGAPDIGLNYRHAKKSWGFHDSTDEKTNAVLLEALHGEIDESHMKICSSQLPTLIEYIKDFKLHGVVIGYGLPNHAAEF